jgi:hypothetical protein
MVKKEPYKIGYDKKIIKISKKVLTKREKCGKTIHVKLYMWTDSLKPINKNGVNSRYFFDNKCKALHGRIWRKKEENLKTGSI